MSASPGAACDRSAVHVRLLRLFASDAYRPPVLPRVALQIVELSQRPSVTFDEVVALLEQDPMLAAKVLSIAESAFYAPRSPILSLKQAAVRLGLAALRDLVVEAALRLRVFRVPGYDAVMERLACHSSATAHLMRLTCAAAGVEAEYAFLCGLLHDVGIAACLLALSDDPRSAPAPAAELDAVLRGLHEEASGLVTRLWGLPPVIQRIAGSHHQLEFGGSPHPVNAALIVAEALACEHGAGMVPRSEAAEEGLDANPAALFEAACSALSLAPEQLEAMRADAGVLLGALTAPAPSREPPR